MELSQLIDLYRGPLVGLIASWARAWSDAAEIAQDSFSGAWLRRDACRGDWTDPEVFGRWLRGVALNQYRNWARRRRRKPAIALTSDVVDRTTGPADDEGGERCEALRRAIARLPARQREVVLMHYLEETSVRQVAALLAVSVKTVEGRFYQARRNLHRMLDMRCKASFGKLLLCLSI